MKKLLLTFLSFFVLIFCLNPLVIAGQHGPKIAKVNSKLTIPQLYANLGAQWWQWALQAPATDTPLVDDGTHCSVGQQGPVWFLAGTFGAVDPVNPTERNCDVPYGMAIFFPVLTNFYGAFLNDPQDQRTAAFVRATTNSCDKSTARNLAVTIDGLPVKAPEKYYSSSDYSPIFQIQLPTDNFPGFTTAEVPELLLSPSAHQGFYIYLNPLPPGQHIIQWSGTWDCDGSETNENIKYNLTVLSGVAGEVQ